MSKTENRSGWSLLVIRLRFDLWEFANHQFRIETKDLDGKTVINPIQGIVEAKGVGNATAVSHLVFTISNIHLKNSGVVNFTLYIDDKELSSIPLYLSMG
jgi:hypothetical protein